MEGSEVVKFIPLDICMLCIESSRKWELCTLIFVENQVVLEQDDNMEDMVKKRMAEF